MITIDRDFLLNELDYNTPATNTDAYFKDLWYTIVEYIGKPQNNRIGLTEEEIEEFINNGTIARKCDYKCKLQDKNRRIYIFKRAMALQLIYTETVGRNSMARGTDEEEDICRETKQLLKILGLLQPVGF